MKNNYFILFFSVFLFFTAKKVDAQNGSMTVLNELALKQYAASYRNGHSIWIHLDKNIYTAGSSIWFSLYVSDNPFIAASATYKTVYVELVNESDSLIECILFNNQAEILAGKIELPDSIHTGSYRFRAYTKTVVQSIPELLAEKVIYVTKPFSVIQPGSMPMQRIYMPGKNASPRFSYFPEGGCIISGIPNNILISAYDAGGNPLQLQGKVTNTFDTTTIRFQTNEWGLGHFILPGIKNRKYKATIQYNGQTYYDSILLPPLIGSQVSVVKRTGKSITIRISLSDSLYKTKPASYLLGISNRKICFAANGKGMYEVEIPLANFPKGVATFNLYNEQKELVSCRSVFIKEEAIELAVNTNQKKYDPREWVKIDISVTDRSGKPLKSHFSVSVTDDSFLGNAIYDSIQLFRFLLRDWLFDKPMCTDRFAQLLNDDTSIDLVMLRMNKKMIGTVVEAATRPEEEILIVQGKVMTKKKEPLSNHTITLLSNQGGSIVKTTTTDSEGNFSFVLPDFYGTTLFNFQVRGAANNIINDAIVSLKDPGPPSWKKSDFIICENGTTSLETIKNYQKRLEQVAAPNKRVTILKESSTNDYYKSFNEMISKRRINKNSWIATPEMIDQAGEGSVGNVVLRAPGASLMGGYLTIQGGMRGVSGVVTARVEPLLIVNGVIVNAGGSSEIGMGTNLSPVLTFINSFSPRNVDFIEVLSGSEGAQYGTVGGNGVILIYTSANTRTGVSDNESNSGIHKRLINGYYISEAFRGPDYSEKQTKANYFSDNRTTIYWEGQSGTDSTGKKTIRFYIKRHFGASLLHQR